MGVMLVCYRGEADNVGNLAKHIPICRKRDHTSVVGGVYIMALV